MLPPTRPCTFLSARVALVFGLFACAPVVAQVRYEGLAYPAGGGGLVYREVHWLYRDGAVDARLVLYRCPDGRAFARKTLREVAGASAPDFEFVDARSGLREGVRSRGAMREVFHRDGAGTRERVGAIPKVQGLVIDAGFDRFVQLHWARLERARVTAPFLVPSRLQAVEIRVGDAVEARERGRPVRRMRMELTGWRGFVVPTIELTYDAADRRLLRFVGPGTIRDARGRLQMLRVEFPSTPVAGVPAAEVAAAKREALVAACDR